jgi:hypothetical protein
VFSLFGSGASQIGPRVVVRPEIDDGAALRAERGDPDATRARLLDRADPRAHATNGSNRGVGFGSNCASGRDGRSEAGEAASSSLARTGSRAGR